MTVPGLGTVLKGREVGGKLHPKLSSQVLVHKMFTNTPNFLQVGRFICLLVPGLLKDKVELLTKYLNLEMSVSPMLTHSGAYQLPAADLAGRC